MNNNPKDNMPLRKASTPYKLSLDKETKLPKLHDLISVDDPELPKFTYFSYTPTSFKGRTLTIRSRYNYNEFYNQHIVLIKDYLLVYCDCDTEVSGLCTHMIELFARLIKDRKHGYFEPYKSFPYSDSAFFDQYLTLKDDYQKTRALPKPEYGHIYNYNNGIDAECFTSENTFCLTPIKTIEEDPVFVSYTIAYAYDAPVPFLMPFSAILNYERTGIKVFECFTDPTIVPERLSPEQKLLYAYSRDFNQMFDFESAHKMHRNGTVEIAQMRHMTFEHWKKIIPLLKVQKYLFCHTFYHKLNYKSRPSKQSMRPVAFADDPVTFRFLLTEHEGHYKLQCKARMSGQDFEVDTVVPVAHPFFFSLKHAPEVHYQFRNLEEGQAISEFVKSGGIFTILKQDFEDFNASILSKLALKYDVTHHWLKKREQLAATIAEKQIRVENQGDYVAFIPTFVYSCGLNVAVNSAGSEILHFKNGTFQVVERDKTAETEFKNYFMELHPAFKKQEMLPYFYLSKDRLKAEEWFARTMYSLNDPDVTFIGLEQLTGIDFHIELPDISINVQEEKGWFDIGVAVNFGDITLSPEEIQKALKKHSSTLSLSNGKTAHLPDVFFNKLSTVFRNGTLTEKGVKIAGQHYTLIDQLYHKADRPDLAKLIAERERLFDEQEKMPLVPVPENLNATLRPYQLIGYSWLCHLHLLKWGGLLADDMGLGKTLQVLTLLQHLKNEGLTTAPHLLLAPTSLLFNWLDEAAKFCPELNVLVFHGFEREKNAAELKKYDLIITSYGTAAVDIEFLYGIRYHYLILDEAQAIKNPFSQKFKMVMLFEAYNRIALTGTPVENSSSDLYALMSFVNPGFFGTLKMFKDNLAGKGDEQDVERAATLLKMTKPFILRRTKKQVATDLPSKTEMTIWCEMEPPQRKIYDRYRKQFRAYLTDKIDADGLENSKLYVLDGLMKLRQICNSPVLMKDAPAFNEPSCKIVELMEHIMEKTTGHKLLIFSAFTGMLALIRSGLDQQGIAYAYLDGKTTLNKRKTAVTNFQENETCRVFLISLKAGGTGLNLTAADYVYLVDPWWNPAVENQAIDRCYRIGQEKHVMAYRMICKDTLEEKILEIQDKKRKLAGELIPTDEGILKSLGKDDLLKLFG
jgi:superfamily II DNA or RNA helicase